MSNEAAERLRKRPAIGSPRDYVETALLDLISNHGGQRIVAGSEMDALRQEIADWHDAALAAERRATVERIRAGVMASDSFVPEIEERRRILAILDAEAAP